MQPQNDLGIHFIRSMLNALAVNSLKLISKQHDEDMISRCLSVKSNRSIQSLWPFKTSSPALDQVRKVFIQDLLKELRQQGRHSSNNENGYPGSMKKARMTAIASARDDKTLKDNQYIRFIIDINRGCSL